jgi:acyl-CoA reductase-like NAD-dependent aldehyde dehydrogenase
VTILQITNPATGQITNEVSEDTPTSLASKWEKAQAAQKRWRLTPMKERLDYAVRFKTLLLLELETLAQDLTRETGKPISQARSEIKSVTSRIDFFVEHVAPTLATQTVSKNGAQVEEKVEYAPLGVVANISAWNYPYFVGLNVLIPALLAGNAVIYKPSEYATLSGLNIVRLLIKAGFPENVIVPVVGGAQVGEALLLLPFDGLFFTGSYKTGQAILDKLGSRMMRLQLELGGKDGIYVCEDARLDVAVASIADGAFFNTGQGCCSVERVFIHEAIYDAFKQAFVKEVASFKLGDPTSEDTYIGALTRPQHLDFLKGQVDDAVRKGHKVLLGGHRVDRPGSFFAPTVVECESNNCAVMSDESFGPIVALQRVRGDEDALRKLNNTNYGLTAGIYTKSKERAMAILREVDVGSAYWNCCDRVSPYLPWGGRKASGVGVTLGVDGIRSFAVPKAWHLKNPAC